MNIQEKEQQELLENIPTPGWLGEKAQLIFGLPLKIMLASSLLVINYFHSKAQQQQLREILKTVRDTDKSSAAAKADLFRYLQEFSNEETALCPLMIKEYSAEEYKTGLLIHGELEWRQALKQIREHLKLPPSTSASFFVGPHLMTEGKVVTFFQNFKRDDGVLYVQYLELESYG